MKRILYEEVRYLWEAEDGRKFQKEDDCKRYEYLCNKWLNQKYETSSIIDDTEIACYPINSYEDIREIQEFERLHDWNYPSIHPQESHYEIPGWVYVPYSPSGLDYPELIEPLSHLEECIKDVENSLVELRNDIAQMRGKH